MKKIIIVAIVIALVSLLVIVSRPATLKYDPSRPTDLTLFWGNGCPHCQKLDEYIITNKIDSKVNISTKEVWYNKANQQLFNESIKKCPTFAANPNSVGVPFAITPDNQCLSGDQPIIDYLTKKLSATQ